MKLSFFLSKRDEWFVCYDGESPTVLVWRDVLKSEEEGVGVEICAGFRPSVVESEEGPMVSFRLWLFVGKYGWAATDVNLELTSFPESIEEILYDALFSYCIRRKIIPRNSVLNRGRVGAGVKCRHDNLENASRKHQGTRHDNPFDGELD